VWGGRGMWRNGAIFEDPLVQLLAINDTRVRVLGDSALIAITCPLSQERAVVYYLGEPDVAIAQREHFVREAAAARTIYW